MLSESTSGATATAAFRLSARASFNPPFESGGGKDGSSEGMRVLIVEDEALLAMDMEYCLTEAGFVVVGIADSETEAVAIAKQQQPDLVLMDIMLRKGDGISAAKTIAKMSPKIIFISANLDSATLAGADALTHQGFIRKPYASDELAGMISAMLFGDANDR